jgi:chromosome segregation protein
LLILKRVEIQGFKSFCDRTEMRFGGRGIAAVVGPNGCGKSNLSDAISWVLGEQSAKSLRGSRMEDVIFAGTSDRKPLGMAQVTMVMVDPEGNTLIPSARPSAAKPGPADSDDGQQARPAARSEQEITITRRLFRSGDSEYLINGKLARLRDIQDLFMGTGLGPESYAIIEQGRIGQILSSKPLDRRSVIEEAAGISKFKTRRRLAEAKLEGAKQNLSRVFDILEEVTRQVNSLKRQAGKARRYEELKGELDQQLRIALTGRYLLLEREAARVALDLNQATATWQSLQTSVETGERELAAAREQFYETESRLTSARERLSQLRIEAERTRGQIESQARQIGSIEQRLDQGESESATLSARVESLEHERQTLAAQHGELALQAGEARQRLFDKAAERDEVQARLRDKERSLELARQQVVNLLGESAGLRNQLAQIETFLNATGRDIERVGRDEQSAQADLERLEAAGQDSATRLAAGQTLLESLNGRRRSVEEELAARRASAQETRRSLDALQGEAHHLRARRDSLNQILSHRAYTAESVKRLFTAVEQGQAGGLKPAGVLADFVDLTDPRFEKATEEFLHEELEYVVVKSWDEARRGVDLLRADLDGRATFLVEPNLHSGSPAVASSPVPEPAIGPETGIVGRLSDGIRFGNGLTNAPAALLPRLARCFLAESREAAQRLAAQYPDLFFLLEDGVCYHGHAVSGGRKTGSGPLALKRELREVAAVCEERQQELAAAQARLSELESEIAALAEELEAVRGEERRQEKETLLLDQEMRKIAEEAQRAERRLAASRVELERLNRDAERARVEEQSKRVLVTEKEQARASVEASLEQGRSEAAALAADSGRLSEEHSVLRVDLSTVEERRRGVEAALARLDNQAREVAARLQSLNEEMGRLAFSKGSLISSNLELEQKAESLAADEQQADALASTLAESEENQRAGLTAREEALKTARQEVSLSQERRAQVELELVRRQGDLRYLDETCRKDLTVPVAELAAARPEDEPPPDDMAVADAEDKVSEIRRRIDALGPVNPEALREFEEAQQRYDFLNTQRQDLLDSIRDTEKAIHEIDTESRKRFNDAFAAINENFKVMFRTLFGGGTGEMRLTGEGDSLEQGIEIVAQPPGKRLQNVLLLSGGEKALTAISLLMGIFQYQPSPFCVLDEVDAPLDEVNVGRFTSLIRDMSVQTQFIVITHAKKTMEAAESLYGVTMQEQGVSKLVSVRLEAPPPVAAATLQPAGRA